MELTAHPLLNQSYIVPTPAIAMMYARVRDCLKRSISGAVIYGHTRWGKTYAIRYCMKLFRNDLPRAVVLSVETTQHLTRSEGLFFGMFLKAVHYVRPNSSTAIQRRLRLYNKLTDMVKRGEGNKLVLFVDEAQRLELEHYEWLRDIQNEFARRGIRTFVFFVGQPGILNRKSAFRQNVDTSQNGRPVHDRGDAILWHAQSGRPRNVVGGLR